MYVAIFLIFAPVGMLVSLCQPDPWGWGVSLAVGTFGGIIAIGWAFAVNARHYWLIVPLNIVPFFADWVFFRPLNALGLSEVGSDWSPLARRLTIAVIMVVGISLGFVVLIRYIIQQNSQAERLKSELDLAARLHRRLVPPIEIRTESLQVLGRSRPSSEVGGDLIDAVARGPCLDVFLADISGHGVRAGVLMAMLKSAIRSRVLASAGADGSLAGVTESLNRTLGQVSEPDMFATFAALRFEKAGEVEFALAGHLPILRVRTDGVVEELSNESMPLGVDDSERFAGRVAPATRGDLFVMFTDGYSETSGPRGELFGLERVKAVLSTNAGRSLEEIRAALDQAVERHGEQIDDRTLVLIRVL